MKVISEHCLLTEKYTAYFGGHYTTNSKSQKKAGVDHFAKQEQLKSALEKLSTYKIKHSSASSIKDAPKRPPNTMKGKPFMEIAMLVSADGFERR